MTLKLKKIYWGLSRISSDFLLVKENGAQVFGSCAVKSVNIPPGV